MPSSRTTMNSQSRQRRRTVPAWTSSVALLLIIASSSTTTRSCVQAFVLPQLRTQARTNPHSMAVRSTEDSKKPFPSLEFETDTKATPLKEESSSNGKEVKNGKSKPADLSSLIFNETEVEDTFEIHVGRALDTLRNDYPKMLTDQPEFSIFDKELEVIDPSGVKLHGIKNYKSAFRFLHGIVKVFYCPERSGLNCRMCYDTARQSIRVSWNAEVIPKAIFGGVRTTLHVDGISVYEISQKSGMITQHRIERLVINDTPVMPQQGIFDKLRNEHDEIPVLGSSVLEFRSNQQPKSSLFDNNDDDNDNNPTSTALTAVSAGGGNDGDGNNQQDYPGLDWDAYERKNATRKKFGLEPITPEEFMETEAIVQKMDSQQRQRQTAASASAAAEMANKRNDRQQGFLDKLLGDVLPKACESNYDCQQPEVCCDFGFRQICCSSGQMVGNTQLRPALVPVPVEMYPPPGNDPPQNF